jgi:hypothetical protein
VKVELLCNWAVRSQPLYSQKEKEEIERERREREREREREAMVGVNEWTMYNTA